MWTPWKYCKETLQLSIQSDQGNRDRDRENHCRDHYLNLWTEHLLCQCSRPGLWENKEGRNSIWGGRDDRMTEGGRERKRMRQMRESRDIFGLGGRKEKGRVLWERWRKLWNYAWLLTTINPWIWSPVAIRRWLSPDTELDPQLH